MKNIKITLLSVATLIATVVATAAEPVNKLNYKFYGFVRGDASFDTRLNATSPEGLFLLYPLDKLPDANGADLNEVASAGIYSLNSRVGVGIGGLSVLNADVEAKMEGDFAGFSGVKGAVSSFFRLRHAYIKLQWNRTALTVGQTWHPMFSPVTPDVIALSVGAPFNPFNRSPQIRADYRAGRFLLSGAAIYQFQTVTNGVEGKSSTYQRQAILPEIFLGVGYSAKNFTSGVGVDLLSIKPRTKSVINASTTYKVDENLSSLSYSAYVKYNNNKFSASAKTVYGQNLSSQSMLGGFGVSKIDPTTKEQEYTNFNHTTTWVSVGYGKKYRANVFGGYTKNLGSDKELVAGSDMYGDGLNISELYRGALTLTYNIPNFQFGVEYEMTTARYGNSGTFDYNKGQYNSSHGVTNNRVTTMIAYTF